ncbi:Uncharacterized protein APZ42_004574, partial [Daphnia magna]
MENQDSPDLPLDAPKVCHYAPNQSGSRVGGSALFSRARSERRSERRAKSLKLEKRERERERRPPERKL